VQFTHKTISEPGQGPEIWSVGQLNGRVAAMLQENFARIWVRGEISNFTQAASGHWYFSIKDERAAVRAVMFRGRAQALGFVPRAGERFEFCATVTLYEPRGDFQLQVETLRRAGQGDLHEAFLALKRKLESEGLFDLARKRPVAPYPRAVGVVTSLAAAALRDVVSAMKRRAPHVPLIVYPAPVQGSDAPAQLVQALQMAGRRAEVDTVLLVRGGGSLEDLWSFNDEGLARAIAASPIPVISGVGHETDFTIADFVADVRAPTPTAAAELSCRPRRDCLDQLQAMINSLTRQQQRIIERASLRLDRAAAMLVSPRQRLDQQRQHLNSLHARLQRASVAGVGTSRQRHLALQSRLLRAAPSLQAGRLRTEQCLQALERNSRDLIHVRRRQLLAAMATLDALNPHRIVQRGYAIVRRQNGALAKNALDLNIGEQLDVELATGSLNVQVVSVSPDATDNPANA
jgi:exodeoxyribonuclease VII large subunit